MDMNFAALRQGQQDAVTLIRERVRAGQKRTALIIPTRYGKSDIARVATMNLVEDGLTTCALALSPNELLRDQLGSLGKWNETLERYRIRLDAPLLVTRLEGPRTNPNANGEIFLSSTIQLVASQLELFADWVESERHRSGLAPMVWDDECHMSSEDNTWGSVCETLVDAGAHLVMMTATGERADGGRIPGFEFVLLDEDEVDVYHSRPGSTPDRIIVQMFHGIRSRLRLKADLEVTFEDAWREECLCKVSHVPFDVQLTNPVDGTPLWLSELSQTQTRKVMGTVVRQADVIAEGCLRFVDELNQRREHFPETTGLIFCSNDYTGGEANKHANAIRRQLLVLAPGLRVTIATSQVDKAKGQINNWVDGASDVLIVKQMASLGLDAPRCKVLLDLSATRTYSGMVQKIMRAATPWAGVKAMTWISPNDVLSKAIWIKLVQEKGGEARDLDLELVKEYEKDRDETESDLKPYVDGTGPAEFDDNDDNRAHAAEWERTQQMIRRFPILIQQYSHAEISQRTVGLHFDDDPPIAVDTHADADATRYEINEMIREITDAHQRDRGVVYSQAAYGQMIQAVWKEAYIAAGWPRGVKLDQTDDLKMLNRLQAVVRDLHARHVR